ncbi:hypothetical protein VN0405_12890 [Helicobacter pylori]|nr:hypothetical protein VN0405_12890 [Helicobacter pylori]
MILSEQETYHEKLMRVIVKNLVDTPMVLKGETALYLGYGLKNKSEDILLNKIIDLEETALELSIMAHLIHKKLEKQSHFP